MRSLLILIFLSLSVPIHAQWIKQTVNTTASFRGLSVVNEKVIWASGTEGIVIRTIDGGKTWKVITLPGAEKLDFRDIEAFDANTAYILSIGNGESSRIYKTDDGGKTWNEEFRNTNQKAFFDALACRSPDSCFAMSDPIDGKFLLIQRTSKTKKWSSDDWLGSPPALTNEASFAASGTCLLIDSGRTLFLVTGGNSARVLRGRFPIDLGIIEWSASDVLFAKGTAGSGIFSIAMRGKYGVIVGGNYEKPNEAKDNLAFTTDRGKTWQLEMGLTGYRSAVSYIDEQTIIAVGTNGTDITRDGGKTWKVFGKEDLNAVQSKGKRATWAVGPKGMVVKMK